MKTKTLSFFSGAVALFISNNCFAVNFDWVNMGEYRAEKVPNEITISMSKMGEVFGIALYGTESELQVLNALAMNERGRTTRLTDLMGNLEERDVKQIKIADELRSIHFSVRSQFSGERGMFEVFVLVDKDLIKDRPVRPGMGRRSTARELFCGYNGANYQPYHSRNRTFVGKAGYGFSVRTTCDSAIAASTNSMVCSWNGSNYQPFHQTKNAPVGTSGYGFSQLSSCSATVMNSNWRFVCQWNGANYQPYNSETNIAIGKTGFGFADHSSCMKAVEYARPNAICQWTGTGYTKYDDNNGVIGAGGLMYRTLDECIGRR